MTKNTIPTEDLYRAVEVDGRWDVQGWNGSAYENIVVGVDKARAHKLVSGMIDDYIESLRYTKHETRQFRG